MRSFMASCVVPTCLAAMAVAGCSGGSSGPAAITPPTSSAVVADGGAAKIGDSEIGSTAGPVETVPAPLYDVVIDVSVARLDLAERLDVEIDPTGLEQIDPFTRFSSCSGLRASIGTFAVTAVDAEATVRSVSVVTVEQVVGPGIYDADVRVESADADPVSASGTMTLDRSLRSGSFQAFESTGESVSGMFACDGPAGLPVPIGDAPADDGVLRAVEVVALLRRGAEERIVGLTLDTAEVAAADAECPGVTGGAGDVLVRVRGGQAVGAITNFELTSDPSPRLEMRVGGASYVVDAVDVIADDSGGSATFSGTTADGITVDGAFRCG